MIGPFGQWQAFMAMISLLVQRQRPIIALRVLSLPRGSYHCPKGPIIALRVQSIYCKTMFVTIVWRTCVILQHLFNIAMF